MDLAAQIGHRLRALRGAQGLTLEQLSSLSGVPPESISRFERGKTLPSLRTLSRLAQGLGLQLSALVDVEVPAKPLDVPESTRGLEALLVDQDEAVIRRARRLVEVYLELERERQPL